MPANPIAAGSTSHFVLNFDPTRSNEACVNVIIVDDATFEAEEVLNLTLSSTTSPFQVVIVEPRSAVINILRDPQGTSIACWSQLES